eukprot:4621309-Lingulodinium_polyedra.AAC.1
MRGGAWHEARSNAYMVHEVSDIMHVMMHRYGWHGMLGWHGLEHDVSMIIHHTWHGTYNMV